QSAVPSAGAVPPRTHSQGPAPVHPSGPAPSPYGTPPAADARGAGAYGDMAPAGPAGPSGRPPGQDSGGYAPAGPGAGPYGEFTFPEVASPGLEPLAVASVATFPIGPLGLGLGIAALRRVRRNRKRSPALAGTGIVLGVLSTAAAVLTILTLVLTGTWDRMTERPVAGDVSAPRVVASANVAPGN